jgi:uncharacterized oxidoreductase
MLITGGGSGIGRALAQRFNDRGNFVIVAGRRIDALEETVAGRQDMAAYVLDVADADAVMHLATDITARHPALNVVVNNAGVMRPENLSVTRDLADCDTTVATNLLGPIRLANALVPHLTKQPASAILNVTSGLAFVPLIATPTYNATKAALHSYTIAMREQLRGQVEVIEIVPPAVETDLAPGQAANTAFMPLDAFADEVMTLLAQDPTASEILVERVNLLRKAEAEGRFQQVLTALNAH